MSVITREQVIQIVKKALLAVGDFNTDNIENFSFTPFNEFEKNLFLKNLSEAVTDADFYITLNPTIGSNWKTMKDCMDYIEDNIALSPI